MNPKVIVAIVFVLYTVIFGLVAHFAVVKKAEEDKKTMAIVKMVATYFGIPLGLGLLLFFAIPSQ